MDGLANEPEPGLVERAVALLEIALEAGGDHVGPGGLATSGSRDHVVHRQLLAAAAAVLAGVAVAPQDVLLVERDALEQRFSDVRRQPDHGREVKAPRGGANDPGRGF